MNRVDKLLDAVKGMQGASQNPILCRLPDGTERPMSILEAMEAKAQFIRTMDGFHDFDELYIAVLNTADADFSDLEELAETEWDGSQYHSCRAAGRV